jgi:hypothetical protein
MVLYNRSAEEIYNMVGFSPGILISIMSLQIFWKFLAGGQFRRFKINQFEKIIKFLLSSFLLFCQRKYDRCIRAESLHQWVFKKSQKSEL